MELESSREAAMIRHLCAVSASAVVALLATSASAQTRVTATMTATPTSEAPYVAADVVGHGGASVALMLAVGSNSLNFGLGARGGYTLPDAWGPGHLYIGGLFSNHFVSGGNVFYLGPEAGYELAAGPVIVRPYLGLGFADEHFNGVTVTVDNTTITSPGASDSEFAFWFGGTALYPVTSSIGVGADARILVVNGYDAFIFTVTGQYHF